MRPATQGGSVQIQSTLSTGSVAINSRLSPWYSRDRLSFDCQTTVAICSCDFDDDKNYSPVQTFSHRNSNVRHQSVGPSRFLHSNDCSLPLSVHRECATI